MTKVVCIFLHVCICICIEVMKNAKFLKFPGDWDELQAKLVFKDKAGRHIWQIKKSHKTGQKQRTLISAYF